MYISLICATPWHFIYTLLLYMKFGYKRNDLIAKLATMYFIALGTPGLASTASYRWHTLQWASRTPSYYIGCAFSLRMHNYMYYHHANTMHAILHC